MAFAVPTQLGTTFNSNTASQTTMGSGAITFPTTSSPVLGIVLIAIASSTVAETFTVQDNASTPNVWTVIAPVSNATGTAPAHTAIAYFLYPQTGSGTTVTVTVSWGTAVLMRFGWFGYTTGHATVSPADAAGTAVGIGSTTSLTITTSGSRAASPTGDNELLLFSYLTGQATAPSTPAAWTTLAAPGDATRAKSAIFAYQIPTGGGGSTATSGAITNTASSVTPPTGSIATFKAAAAATVTPPRPTVVLQAVNRSYTI